MVNQNSSKMKLSENMDKTVRKLDYPNLQIYESDKTLEWLTNSLQIAIFKTKLDGTLLYVNDYARKILEYDSVEEMYANSILAVYKDEKDREIFIEKIKEFSELEKFEADFKTKTGKIKNFVLSAILNGDCITGMAIDITDNKKAGEALENSLSILRSILESTTDGILVVNKDGCVADFNHNFINMWKIPLKLTETREDQKLINFVIDQLKYPEDFIKKINELYNNPEEESHDLLEFKDGRVFERYSRPQRQDNEIIGRVWCFRDVTEKKRSQRLQDAVYKISQAANKARDLDHLYSEIHKTISKFINAKNFYIALYNPGKDLLSFPYFVDEFDESPTPRKPGRGLTEYVIRKGEPALVNPKMFAQLIKRGEVERVLTDSIDWLGVPLKTTEKTIGALVVQTYTKDVRYTDDDKEFLSFVSNQTAMAIEREQSKEELIKAKDKAEEMNRLKSSFLANMSHELRTPMVGILGYIEILKDELVKPELKEMSEEIFLSANRLLETLNLILDLSKIEANKSEINKTELNIGEITVNQVENFEERAKKKNVSLKISIKDEQVYSSLDERIFRQIINNLVSNAIKFTNVGGVTVEVDKKLTGEEEKATLSVTDSGIGIPINSQQIIFEEFRQASEGLNRIFEGSGLGLSITKKFVEMMDGEISVHSEVGRGSTFTVSFPLSKKERQIVVTKPSDDNGDSVLTRKQENSYDKNLHHILLVEDDFSNAGVLEYLLQGVCNLDIAETGEQALDLVSQKQYSVILMDIDLGRGISGMETTKRIRKIKGYKDLPIIAVTALAMQGQKEIFLEAGCSLYVSKPYDGKTLLKLIEELLPKGKPNAQ